MSGLFTSIRFIMALLTVLAIAAKPFIPPKTLSLHPNPKTVVSLYGSPDMRGEANIRWLDKSIYAWRCDYFRRINEPGCGLVISWNTTRADNLIFADEFPRCANRDSDPDGDGWGWENNQSCIVDSSSQNLTAEMEVVAPEYPACSSPTLDPDGDGWGWENDAQCKMTTASTDGAAAKPVDLATPAVNKKPPGRSKNPADKGQTNTIISVDGSQYDGLLVRIHYEGRADYLRMSLRNSNPALREQGYSEKFMSASLRTADLRAGPTYVGFNEFAIDDWWIFQENPPRALAAPEFGHIIQVGVYHSENGVHRVRVDEIQLIGERISKEAYLTAIALFWIGYLFLEMFARYYQLRRSTHQHQEQLQHLAGNAQKLQQEKTQLQNRSMTDPLTGVLNRNGIATHLQQIYGGPNPPAGTGLLVMDIDHFKTLNDTFGHAVGDQVLQQFAGLVSAALREGDIFGRWGGEEFVVIVGRNSPETLALIAEKLRRLVAAHDFFSQQSTAQSAVAARTQITVSIGLTDVRADDCFEAVFKRADTALYQAKKCRNMVSYAS